MFWQEASRHPGFNISNEGPVSTLGRGGKEEKRETKSLPLSTLTQRGENSRGNGGRKKEGQFYLGFGIEVEREVIGVARRGKEEKGLRDIRGKALDKVVQIGKKMMKEESNRRIVRVVMAGVNLNVREAEIKVKGEEHWPADWKRKPRLFS